MKDESNEKKFKDAGLSQWVFEKQREKRTRGDGGDPNGVQTRTMRANPGTGPPNREQQDPKKNREKPKRLTAHQGTKSIWGGRQPSDSERRKGSGVGE